MVAERPKQLISPPDMGIELLSEIARLRVLAIKHLRPESRKLSPHPGELISEARIDERQPIRGHGSTGNLPLFLVADELELPLKRFNAVGDDAKPKLQPRDRWDDVATIAAPDSRFR